MLRLARRRYVLVFPNDRHTHQRSGNNSIDHFDGVHRHLRIGVQAGRFDPWISPRSVWFGIGGVPSDAPIFPEKSSGTPRTLPSRAKVGRHRRGYWVARCSGRLWRNEKRFNLRYGHAHGHDHGHGHRHVGCRDAVNISHAHCELGPDNEGSALQ